MHVPQSLTARAEAQELMQTADQMLLHTTGSISVALQQDSLLGAFLMSARDAFFDRSEAMQLAMWAMSNQSRVTVQSFPPPAIAKPRQLWTGKQLLSMTFPDFLQRSTPSFSMRRTADDSVLVVHSGRVLAGRLDKRSIGRSSRSLLHDLVTTTAVAAGERSRLIEATMDALEVMTKSVHEIRGFSVGVGDMMLMCRRVEQRMIDGQQRTLACWQRENEGADLCCECEAQRSVHQAIIGGMNAADRFIAEDQLREARESHDRVKGLTSAAAQVDADAALDRREKRIVTIQDRARDDAGRIMADAFRALQPSNAVQAMADAGSKGTMINLSQMAACIGAQTIEGRRVVDYSVAHGTPRPIKTDVDGQATHSAANRLLSQARYRPSSHFSRVYANSEAGGFVPDSFMSGVSPRGFFDSMRAGRQGLIDTAMNTSNSGYLQRRMIKGTEDLTVRYDATVRNTNNRIVQFVYGASPERLQSKRVNEAGWSDEQVLDRLTWMRHCDANDVFCAEAARIFCAIKRLRHLAALAGQPLLDVVEVRTVVSFDRIFDEALSSVGAEARRRRADFGARLPSADSQERIAFVDMAPDVAPLHAADVCRAIVNVLERIRFPDEVHRCEAIVRLSSKQLCGRLRVDQTLLAIILTRVERAYERCLVEPGESVGCIAAQSMGEPATQATLNISFPPPSCGTSANPPKHFSQGRRVGRVANCRRRARQGTHWGRAQAQGAASALVSKRRRARSGGPALSSRTRPVARARSHDGAWPRGALRIGRYAPFTALRPANTWRSPRATRPLDARRRRGCLGGTEIECQRGACR